MMKVTRRKLSNYRVDISHWTKYKKRAEKTGSKLVSHPILTLKIFYETASRSSHRTATLAYISKVAIHKLWKTFVPLD